ESSLLLVDCSLLASFCSNNNDMRPGRHRGRECRFVRGPTVTLGLQLESLFCGVEYVYPQPYESQPSIRPERRHTSSTCNGASRTPIGRPRVIGEFSAPRCCPFVM